jgi:hypothetical protein
MWGFHGGEYESGWCEFTNASDVLFYLLMVEDSHLSL